MSKMMTNKKERILQILTWIKYIFPLVFIVIGFLMYHTKKYALVGFLEQMVIVCLSDILVRKNKWIGRIVNAVLMLLLNVQLIVRVYGGVYVSRVMLTNLYNLEDLSGQAVTYGLSAAAVLIVILIPIVPLHLKQIHTQSLLSFTLACELAVTMIFGSSFSPFYGIYDLVDQQISYNKMRESLSSVDNAASQFYRASIPDRYEKDEALVDNPNIILIFTEGLSQNIVTDERNIMPNVKAYEEQSLNFTKYYNHTFATFRGLEGQLYSGYQASDQEANNLVSMQSILSDNGYTTTFINPEPRHREFSRFLDEFDFDEVVGDPTAKHGGPSNSLTDKEMYELIYDTAEEKAQGSEPFFIAAYTFGTHASFKSPDEVYGDGSDDELNKFYNLDVQFGAFMEKFNESDMTENTIIVFTTDHCTYADAAFTTSFPDYERDAVDVDEIPFFIYYKGIEPKTMSAQGRNSLCMAQTVLDFIDISGENYFLGYQLLYSNKSVTNYDTVFYDASNIYSTAGGEIRELTDTELTIVKDGMHRYFAAATQDLG